MLEYLTCRCSKQRSILTLSLVYTSKFSLVSNFSLASFICACEWFNNEFWKNEFYKWHDYQEKIGFLACGLGAILLMHHEETTRRKRLGSWFEPQTFTRMRFRNHLSHFPWHIFVFTGKFWTWQVFPCQVYLSRKNVSCFLIHTSK